MVPTPHAHKHGAELSADGVDYHLWCPEATRVSALIERNGQQQLVVIELVRSADGWFAGTDPRGKVGDLYFYQIDAVKEVPDVASRCQPKGVRGPSQVIDLHSYSWRCTSWECHALPDLIVYELHVGTFSYEGTFASAIQHLDDLCRLGINAIELMPVGAFPGNRNWGYDVVLPFAPADCYGTPDDLRRLVDAAHERNLAVIMDVVYNHVCGEPNWLEATSADYFHHENGNEWGKCLNFDGKNCAPVREYFLQNVIYWLEEFRVDGFRLDAIHAIHDSSPVHILQEITQAVHARNGIVIAEDNSNDAKWLRPVNEDGIGMDAAWADDFHHVVKMSVKPEQIAHFKSYVGTAKELVETLEHGWLYRGDTFPYWNKPRGTACRDLAPAQFVYCISNHDQAGNRPLGERLHQLVSPVAYRAASMLFLLSPYTPMLFMGQEWAASSPFVFFTNHEGGFGAMVSEGRRKEFKQFGAEWPAEALTNMPDPERGDSFTTSKLNWRERDVASHREVLELYRKCLRLRKEDAVLKVRERSNWRVWTEGEVLFLLYGTAPANNSRLLVIYLHAEPIADLAWPESLPWCDGWSLLCSTEDRCFGGTGGEMFDIAKRRFSFNGPTALLLTFEK